MKYLDAAIKEALKAKDKVDIDFGKKVHNKSFTVVDIKMMLTEYKVIRNFRGDKNSRFKKLVIYLKKHGYERNASPVDIVNRLIKLIIEEYDFVATSAASKILWYFYKDLVVMYDKNAVLALKDLGARGVENNYEFFYYFWMIEYNKVKDKISSECKKKGIEEWNQKSFKMRVFDKYLWCYGNSLK